MVRQYTLQATTWLHGRDVRGRNVSGRACAASCRGWQGRRDSNPRPPVLETGALPLSYAPARTSSRAPCYVPRGAVSRRSTPLPLVQRAPACVERGGLRPRGGLTPCLSRRPGQHPFRGAGRGLPAGHRSRPYSICRQVACRVRYACSTCTMESQGRQWNAGPHGLCCSLALPLGEERSISPRSAPDRNVQRPRSPITGGGT